VNDRSDELSTADLAGQSAGSGAEPADRTAERNEAFPADRPADADYADDRSDHGDDRVGGAGSRGFPGGTPADQATYADDDPTMGTGRADDAAVTGDRAGYAGGAEVSSGPMTDDRGFGAGVGAGAGGPGVDAAGSGYPTGEMREPGASTGTPTGGGAGGTEAGPLLNSADTEGFRARWTDVQTGFVDAPRRSVEQADALVAELMQHLAKSFADERGRLESQWDRGEDIATDDLRTAFQRYRSFFERLLST